VAFIKLCPIIPSLYAVVFVLVIIAAFRHITPSAMHNKSLCEYLLVRKFGEAHTEIPVWPRFNVLWLWVLFVVFRAWKSGEAVEHPAYADIARFDVRVVIETT
jgi:hypothetical protein